MKLLKLTICIFLFGAAFPALSAPVSFVLGDHPDGGLYTSPNTSGANGPYGLRYDAIDPPAGNGPTFSVGSNLGGNGGVVTLSWDDANLAAGANISGTIWNNSTDKTWTVDYDLTGLVSDGNGGWTATGGSGNMTEDSGPGSESLTGKQGGGYAFIFANDGHRIDGQSTGWVGRGWLVGDGTNDWLVTAVPVPAAAWLFGSALLGLGVIKRRKA